VVIEIGPILHDFTIVMIVASVMALVSYKLKQPMVIGYIIAGMIIGPYTPPFGLVLNLDVSEFIFRNWGDAPLVCCGHGIPY
jgi:CPA2 family monovalent cation:H+ antiporter-2